ncbi:MAG: bifunctional UDP-N-acetylglucosamine diphosphorylase/glucosamine-1-phosphate N-acetyltransferase GlmU [Gammaproteobacteria bacterium]|nr:bifunctional UDP-N-acetylglucosamine diphosphorylase/glucosamine-1-phosphate N-acetyltransferase GlmU [Gammaproteobacteria bacterium]
MKPSIVILAAGMGKRMRSNRPKVLAPLAGEALLAHVLKTARALDPARIVVVYGNGGEAVRDAFPDPGILWARQNEQLGTADALAAALPQLPENGAVLVLCGDVPLLRAQTLAPLVEAADDALVVLTAKLDDPHGYGRILRTGDGTVTGIVEERDANASERAVNEVNTGVIAAPAGRLRDWLPRIGNDNAQGEYYLTDAVALAVGDGVAVQGVEARDVRETRGINHRAELAAAEAVLRARRAEALMSEGAVLADPARVDVRGEVACGRDVFIDINVILGGRVKLGDGARIGAGCVISDAEIGAQADIQPYSVIEHARVGAQARVGPYARLRPGSELAEEAHVGNFVEIKNTKLGRGSKANHLAYLGDAEIGRGVNVGAGVITCNYDGAAKHRTVIGDEAFIGSDCPLVAPVTIGRGATVGAGSVITQDVPPDTLALGRSRQMTIEGWERPMKQRDETEEK